jgi:hypothetical protein
MNDRHGSRFEGARDWRAWLLVAFGVLGAHGCGVHAGYQRLANGNLHVECSFPLLRCLKPAVDACPIGYDVVFAKERREITGSPPEQAEFVKSEAIVRCRESSPLFGHDPNQPVGPALAPAHVAMATPPRCVPGTSQACTAPSCAGAQVCAADGTRFGPCECASATPSATPNAAPSAASSAAP